MLFTIKRGEMGFDSGQKVLIGDEILIEVTDLPKNQKVKIHARRLDDKNQLWYSHATYISDDEGAINTKKSTAISGTYKGVDPIGLFYSMEIIPDPASLPTNLTPVKAKDPEKIFLYFDVETEAEIVASKNMEALKMLPEVTCEPVKEEGLVANFYYPQGGNDLPVVIAVSGSEGGISTPDIVAGVLASKGYAALALAYFNMPGLPEILEEIPLEYFEKAIDWISGHIVVNKEKIAMIGTSKGAELTLLSASNFPQIKAVVAASPSDVVFQAVNPDPASPPKSSWTYKEKSIPYVPFIFTEEFIKQFMSKEQKPFEFLSLYKASLKDQEAVEKAAIKVEKTNGPILLISGDDDRVWPSKEMSEKMVERLKTNEFPFEYRHLCYESAGHMVAKPGYMPWQKPYYVLGGSPEINGRAQADSWKTILKFLEDNLR